MNKFLTRVCSTALALSVTFAGMAAPQAAKKLTATGGTRVIEQKAAPQSADKRAFHVQETRTLRASETNRMLHAAASTATLADRAKYPLKALGADANLPNLVGCVTFNDKFTEQNQPVGLYYIKNGYTEEMLLGPTAQYGGVEVDGIYYTTTGMSFWGMIFVTITPYDLESGEALTEFDGSADNMAICTAVDPTTGTVYAITYNADATGLQLATIAYTPTSATTTAIAPIEGYWNSLACDADGQLYGISYEIDSNENITSSTLCKIDKATGSVTEVGETGQKPQYMSSATIDAASGRMFWNVCPPDETGLLCEVNLSTGVATTLFQFADNDEIMGMYIAKPLAESGAPAAVTDLECSFPGGALSGTVSFKAPTTLFDGTETTGALTYEVLANGASVASGNTTFGADVNAPVTLTESGEYTFVVTVSNAVGKSPKAKTSAFVGNGIPAKPTATLEYSNGQMNLTWTPVTTTVDGGYIDASAVTYTVTRYPDEVKVADKTTDTSFSEAIAKPANIITYHYTVVAHGSGGMNSAAASSNSITLGSIVPPYLNDFNSADALGGYELIDSNEDGKKWTISDGKARMVYNTNLAMDDWMITPPVQLEAGKAYRVSFKAAANSSRYAERIEAKWGTEATVAGMTNDLVSPTDLKSNTFVELGDYIVPATSGIYYVGIHGISDANMYYLYVDDLAIAAASAATAPGAATNLTVVPDPDGAYKATITFNAPAVDLANATLGSLTKVELRRNGQVIKTFENPATGDPLSHIDDKLTETGNATYTVQGFNNDGDGKTVSATVFIGVDKPAAPSNVNIVETSTLGEVTISWDAVTTDHNGNTINPSLVKYLVCTNPDGEGWVPITEELSATTYTFQAVPEGEQDFVQYAVFAITESGNNGAVTPMIVAGTPYDGVKESFANGTLNSIWGIDFTESGGSWTIFTDSSIDGISSQDADNGFAAMKGQYLESTSGLISGKISLANAVNPGISFYTYNIIGESGISDDINEIDVYVKEATSADWAKVQNIVVNSLTDEDGWASATVSLSAYAGKVIQVRLQATVKQYQYIFVDNIKIGSMLGNDLAASAINAPATVKTGDKYTVNVTVDNNGTLDATEFSVELYADNELVDTKSVETLATGNRTTVSFERSMDILAESPVEYYAVVKYTADEDPDNNTSATIAVTPKASTLPAVTDLKGEATAEGVKLTWSEPDLTAAPIERNTVDFEDAESFAHEYADWTFVDVDGLAVGGFMNNQQQDIPIPGITAGETTASFFVFDDTNENFTNEAYAAHSGDKYLASLFLYEGDNCDDWVISPALDGTEQTITFWAKSYSSSYPETIEMLYSTGSTNTADFVKVDRKTALPTAWTEYSFDVPAGAKYFAIRSCDTNAFMLMLDDFTFAAAGGTSAQLTLVGYDVYRDGEKITSEPTGETEFVDTEATEGNHTYVVVTVYETGTSSASNAVTVAVSSITDTPSGAVSITAGNGKITITGADGLGIAVAALDGKLLYSGEGQATTTVNVATGVYIVKAGDTVVKVAVN